MDRPSADATTPESRLDPEVAALKARVLANLDLQLRRDGDKGHQARYRRLRREGHIPDAVYFAAIERELGR